LERKQFEQLRQEALPSPKKQSAYLQLLEFPGSNRQSLIYPDFSPGQRVASRSKTGLPQSFHQAVL
jgi:hypothetical protein